MDVANLASLFYSLFHKAISFLKRSGHTFQNMKLCNLLAGDKICRLKLQWNGSFFKNYLTIFIDVVPAIHVKCPQIPERVVPFDLRLPETFFIIPKTSRLSIGQRSRETSFHLSSSHAERDIIEHLDARFPSIKHGLILAKAARIARPVEDLTSHYDLREDIHVDDYITSHMLKSCLIKLLPKLHILHRFVIRVFFRHVTSHVLLRRESPVANRTFNLRGITDAMCRCQVPA